MDKGFAKERAVSGLGGANRWLSYAAIAALGLLSLGLYLLFFRPITNEVLSLESELKRTHQQIAETGFGYPDNPGSYLKAAHSKLKKMRRLADELSEHKTFHDGIERLIVSPFRVLEFEQRRFDIEQSLIELAQAQGSRLPDDFLSGLPSYHTATEEEEQLLWLHLEFFNHVMVALLSSGRELRIEQVESLPIRTLEKATQAEGSLFQVQLHLRVAGHTSTLASFLNASLTGSKDADKALPRKAYSIDRIDLYRVADGEDRLVTLDTQLTGYVISEQSL